MTTKSNDFARNLALWVIVALLMVALFNLFQPTPSQLGGDARWVAYSDFVAEVNAGRVREVVFMGHRALGSPADGGRDIRAHMLGAPEPVADLARRATERGARVTARPDETYVGPISPSLFDHLLVWLPLLAAFGVWAHAIRSLRRATQDLDGLRIELDGRLRRLKARVADGGMAQPPAGAGG